VTRVFVSVDMEGIAGIAALPQVWRGSDDFPRSRMLMTMEANAAVEGAFEGGATAVVVNDSHGDMYNLLQEEMDARAELLIGTPKVPWSMMQGFGPDFAVVLFIGYHASAGTAAAVLDHTYSGRMLYEVRVNGEAMSETDLNAILAGGHGVPVGLVTGDGACCAQASRRLPGVRTVAVKEAFGRGVALSMHPQVAREAIRQASAGAVRSAVAGELSPCVVPGPYELEVDVVNTAATELCALVPSVSRTGPRTVRFESGDFGEVYRCLLAFTYIGASEAPRYAGT
jgi:D-amino peptidase